MQDWIADHLRALETLKRTAELEAIEHQQSSEHHQIEQELALGRAVEINAELADWRHVIRYRAESEMGNTAAAGVVQACAERLGLEYSRRRVGDEWAVVVDLAGNAEPVHAAMIAVARERGGG